MLTKSNIVDFCLQAYHSGYIIDELSDDQTEVKDFAMYNPKTREVGLLVLYPHKYTLTELQQERIRWCDKHGNGVLFCIVDDIKAARRAMNGL